MSPDDIITQITQAPTSAHALAIASGVRSRKLLLAVADLLYIEADSKTTDWLRKAIVKEARA